MSGTSIIAKFLTVLNNYAHQRETSDSSSDSYKLRPFSKLGLLLKKRICSRREHILSFKSSPYIMDKRIFHIRFV